MLIPPLIYRASRKSAEIMSKDSNTKGLFFTIPKIKKIIAHFKFNYCLIGSYLSRQYDLLYRLPYCRRIIIRAVLKISSCYSY